MVENDYENVLESENKYKFQGQEHQDDFDLNWYQFKWRMHDPAIGRFMVVDPLAEDYYYNSPYAFSENKVTSHIELEGLEAVSQKILLKAALQSNVSNSVANANESAKNVLSGKVGVQGAGIGGKIQVGQGFKLNAEGKAFTVELSGSGKPDGKLSSSVVSAEFGLTAGNNFDVSFGQDDIKTDLVINEDGLNGDVKIRDTKGNAKIGNLKYSTGENTDNEFSLGVTCGNISAEISANLDAAKAFINYSVEAIGNFFGNMVDSMINPQKEYDKQNNY